MKSSTCGDRTSHGKQQSALRDDIQIGSIYYVSNSCSPHFFFVLEKRLKNVLFPSFLVLLSIKPKLVRAKVKVLARSYFP